MQLHKSRGILTMLSSGAGAEHPLAASPASDPTPATSFATRAPHLARHPCRADMWQRLRRVCHRLYSHETHRINISSQNKMVLQSPF